MHSRFEDQLVSLTLHDGDLECVILGVVEEVDAFYYKVLLEGGETVFISTQDVLRIAVLKANGRQFKCKIIDRKQG